MSHQEMMALKLQMGIDPSVKIAPNVLMAMWQQLKFECTQKLRNQSNVVSNPDQMTSTPK